MEMKHINKEILKQYHANQLSMEDTHTLLEHISKCTYCADLFAGSFDEHDMIIPAPKNLKESILVEVQNRKVSSSKRQLFFYSLRVCTAMCGALFLIISSFWSNGTISPTPEFTHTVSDSLLHSMNESMNEFTYQVNERMNTFIMDKQKTNNGGNIND